MTEAYKKARAAIVEAERAVSELGRLQDSVRAANEIDMIKIALQSHLRFLSYIEKQQRPKRS